MRCIYCLEQRPTRGRAHIFPEALKRNLDTLPLGAVCDPCNEYLGQLDHVLVAHPLTSFAIQFLGLKGKKGRVRAQVGNVDRTVKKGAITMPCAEPIAFVNADGSRGYRIRPLVAPTFDMLRFRRGLHHVALNLLAAMDGVEAAHEAQYDAVRRYVRAAAPNESWPYAQFVISLDRIDNALFGGLFDNNNEKFAALRFFNVSYFVDLLNSNGLHRFVEATQPPGTEVVEANWQPEPEPPQGTKRYRVSVFLE